MNVATVTDADRRWADPRKDPNVVVVNINGRCFGFRRAGSRATPPPLPSRRPPPLPARRPVSQPVIQIDTSPRPRAFRDHCRSFERRFRAWWVSATVQGLVIGVLAIVVMSALENDGSDVLEVRTVAVADDSPELQTFEIAVEVGAEFSEPLTPQSRKLPEPTAHVTPAPSPFRSERPRYRSAAGPVGLVNGDLAGGGGQLLQEVKKPPTAAAEFFGVKATGNTFVFVVDSSNSMRGNRWRHATRELVAAISKLSPEQSFYVIFFDAGPRPMFGKRLAQAPVKATPENLLRLRRWMRNIEFGKLTTPQTSVQFAMNLKPDAVYLLTDGEFHDKTIEVLRDDNHTLLDSGQTQIRTVFHTIGFQSRASQQVLMKIAEENGGTFRLVE